MPTTLASGRPVARSARSRADSTESPRSGRGRCRSLRVPVGERGRRRRGRLRARSARRAARRRVADPALSIAGHAIGDPARSGGSLAQGGDRARPSTSTTDRGCRAGGRGAAARPWSCRRSRDAFPPLRDAGLPAFEMRAALALLIPWSRIASYCFGRLMLGPGRFPLGTALTSSGSTQQRYPAGATRSHRVGRTRHRPAQGRAAERRGWDLNPRRACTLTSLAGRHDRPDSVTSPGVRRRD